MKKIKLTKKQVELLKHKVLLNENSINKAFNTAFTNSNVKDIKYIPEEIIDVNKDFNIRKPLPNIKTKIRENIKTLLEIIYGVKENRNLFLENYGLTLEKICEELEKKGYLIKKEGSYKVSKKMGDVNTIKEGIVDSISEMIIGLQEENIPMGTSYDSDAPWNSKELELHKGNKSTTKYFTVIYGNVEIVILRDNNNGELYLFYHNNIEDEKLLPYVDRLGSLDVDGDVQYTDDYEVTDETIENYINDNFTKLRKGEGVEAFESDNVDLVKIDGELKDELLMLFDKDSELVIALNPIAESTGASSSGAYTAPISFSSEKVKKYNSENLPPVVSENKNITQWNDGEFVEFDDCVKLNNNNKAKNGGCSVGAIDNVVKTKKTLGNITAPSLKENTKLTLLKLKKIIKN